MSKFAPAERASVEDLQIDFLTLQQNQYVVQLLDSFPFVAAILNQERQIVFSNKILLSEIGQLYFEQIIGNRIGEIFECKNSKNETGGCGTSKNCQYCGAVNSILESQTGKRKVTYECRIFTNTSSKNKWQDIEVTASPFVLNKINYTILTVVDISDQKRRRALEKIFFHDIINKVGSLNGLFELINDVNYKDRANEFLDIAFSLSKDITDEILAQKELLAAENEELKLNVLAMSIRNLLSESSRQMQNHIVGKNRIIKLDTVDDCIVETDAVLLKRIVTNMLKNALEAVKEGDMISIGCSCVSNEVSINVNNPGYIPENIQSEIFKRSFSTKSGDRGLGTYSMKLLGERYLKGNVGYFTSKKEGTTFFIKLPLS